MPPIAERLAGDDRQLMRRHGAGDRRARQTLIERYLPLARSLARRYHVTREPMDDLVQVASLGLVKAVDRWDPDRGLAFSTFAVPTILGELRRYFRDSTWLVRPPRDLLELSLQIERVRGPLGATLGTDPTAAELAVRLGRPAEEIAEALRAGRGRWASPLPSVPIEDSTQSAHVELTEARLTLEGLLPTLEPHAREMLRLRFDDDLPQVQIAARTGRTQMDVSRIIRSSLEQLSLRAAA